MEEVESRQVCFKIEGCLKSTNLRASLAAKWSISAQETIPGHRDSNTLLILSISANPPSPRFCGAFFSGFGPSSSSIDASQP